MRHSLLFVFFLVVCYLGTATATEVLPKKTKDLSSIKNKITAIQKEISQDENKLNQLNMQLKKSEKNASTLTQKSSELSKKILEQQKQLLNYKAKKKTFEEQIEKQQNTLGKLIASNYSLQRQGRAGIYFSGNSADETQRFLKYYQTLDIAVIQQINAIHKTIEELNEIMAAISSKTAQLKHSLKDYTQEIDALKKAEHDRQKAILEIHETLNTHRKVLEQLLKDRKRLGSLVEHLEKPTTQLAHLAFEKQKGKLNWPTQGKIKYVYLEPMANESVRWQGDLIEAKTGAPVRAIYDGKVIYSDWLRGYGFLVIVDHGDHYLSLYARNDTITHKVGDYVVTGDIVGTVGQSGGFQEPALYFELRHKTQAINPRDWFVN